MSGDTAKRGAAQSRTLEKNGKNTTMQDQRGDSL